MATRVLSIHPTQPEPDRLTLAVDILRGGGLVAFPTETVYGLGANALDARAVQSIYEAKGRPSANPIIVHVPQVDAARALTTAWPETADLLAACFWPGPLTLVLPRAPEVPDIVTAGGPTVALRVPAHPVALALLRQGGMALAAPSANRSNHLSPTRAEHVLADLNGRIDLILDGGPTSGGLESTVLDLTCQPPKILRPGLISPQQIEAVVGPVQRPTTSVADPALRSPGLLPRHYAPTVPLEMAAGPGWLRVLELCQQGKRIGWLTQRPSAGERDPAATVVRLAADVASYSASLYAALRFLENSGVERIVVDAPPQGDEWLAVSDRLTRACAL